MLESLKISENTCILSPLDVSVILLEFKMLDTVREKVIKWTFMFLQLVSG